MASTNELQAQTLKLLNLHGYLAFGVKNGATYDPKTKRWRKPSKRLYTAGVSDIVACKDGQFFAIEIKNAATKDKQSDAQSDFQAQVEKHGGTYVIIRDIDEAVAFVAGLD